MRVIRQLVALPLLVALFLIAPITSAQGQTAERRSLYQKGLEALNAKDWPEAERIFKQLWTEHPTYDVALDLGQAEVLQKKYRDAAEHLAFGLRNFPPREKPEAVELPKRALAEAKKHVGAVLVVVDRPGAEVLVDGQGAGTSPLSGELFLEPDSHTLEAQFPEHPALKRTIQVQAGEEQTVEFAFSSTQSAPLSGGLGAEKPSRTDNPPEHVASPTHRSANWIPAGISGGLAVVALGVGTWLEFDVKSAKNDAAQKLSSAQSQFGQNPCSTPAGSASADCVALQKIQDRRNHSQTGATISLIAGSVFAVSAVVSYFVWARPSAEAASAAHLDGWLGPSGGGLRFQGQF